MRLLPKFCLLLGLVVLTATPALSRQMRVVEMFPAGGTTIDGKNAQYHVRFDGPVDHRTSRLWIVSGSTVVQELHPLLDSAPTTLFASAPALSAGAYELHWQVRSPGDADITQGSSAFQVGG
jgi:methionine-rich copper-binding protein CopC